MNFSRFSIALAVVSVMFLGVTASRVQALPLPIGGGLFPVPGELEPFGGTARPPLEGAVAFGSGGMTGTLTSKFWLNDTTSPWYIGVGADNGYTFTYIFSNDAASNVSLTKLIVSSFEGYDTNVSYRIPARVGNVLPSLADRMSSDDAVGFTFLTPGIDPNFLGTLEPGSGSAFLVVQTNATRATRTTAIVEERHITLSYTVPLDPNIDGHHHTGGDGHHPIHSAFVTIVDDVPLSTPLDNDVRFLDSIAFAGSSVEVSSWGPLPGSPIAVPEPGSFFLAAIGLAGLLSFVYYRRQ